MNEEVILEQYRDVVSTDSAKARALIKQLEYKKNAYLLKCIAQTYLDESRFSDNGTLRRSLYLRKWKLAEKYIIRAYLLDSDNAEIIYTMGEVRKSLYQKKLAIYCFHRVIKMHPEQIASGSYGRGISFAWELINDSRFELYRLYHKDKPLLAKRYLLLYKRTLKRGVSTIFEPLENFLLKEEL